MNRYLRPYLTPLFIMGRSKILPMYQPGNEPACGPVALKMAMNILGKRTSLNSVKSLCTVTRNGTSTNNMVKAAQKLGLPTLTVKYATLRHLLSALRTRPNKERAVIVSYLYDKDANKKLIPESGHWAVVSSYLASKGRIVLLDSASGGKKSYAWNEFRERWTDYDLKRRRVGPPAQVGKRGKYKIVRRWQPQLMMVLAKESHHLPNFSISSAVYAN